MQFTKLRSMELKHSAVNPFCIQSYGNSLVIENPVMEAVVLQLNNEPDVAELFPYVTATIDVPPEQLATNLLKGVDLRQIYDKLLVHEQQELGVDSIFVAECSIEPGKPRLRQAQFSPASVPVPMLATISTYGACHILMKNSHGRLWNQKVGNLTKLLVSDVFPIDISPKDLKTLKELKDFVNLYVITACTWHNSGSIIYTANVAGFIIAFKVEFDSKKEDAAEKVTWSFLSKISADIGRISYLKAFDDYLIAVSVDGVIRLFKWISQEKGTKLIGKLELFETLWDQKDQMICEQIVVQKCKSHSSFMILFAKGAHIICMRISSDRKIEDSTTLYVRGVQITGLELFHENEIIVTTTTGNILRVTISCIREKDSSGSLRLKADSVTIPNVDLENIQILGVGTSINKALWVFMTHPNKEMAISTKQAISPSHLILCKSSIIDPLAQLIHIPIDTIDPYHDLMLALRMDVWHSNISEKYDPIFPLFLNNMHQKTLDDTFLRKMQIQLEIARAAFRRSSYKLQIVDEVISREIEFLELGIQIIHILLRLEYLQGLIDNERLVNASAGLTILTEFQQRTVYSMLKNFHIFIEKLKMSAEVSSKKDKIVKLQSVTLEFVELAFRILRSKCQDFEIINNTGLGEKCLLCFENLNDRELMCRHGHNLRRCCVSFIQLPWFSSRACPQCGTMALDNIDSHNALAELFPTNQSVKCTFCRSNFVNKEI